MTQFLFLRASVPPWLLLLFAFRLGCSDEPVVGRGIRLEVRDPSGFPIGGAAVAHRIVVRRNPAVALSNDDERDVSRLVIASQPIDVDTLPTEGVRELTGRTVAPGILEIYRADIPARLASATQQFVTILAIQAPGFKTILDDRFEFELGTLTPGLPAPIQAITLEPE